MKKILLALLLLPLPSYAVSLYCTGGATKTYTTSGGNVYVYGTWRDQYARLCNLNGTVNSIGSITCSMWASYIATAVKDNKQVTVSFNANDGDTCANLPTYDSAPKVRYVMLRDSDV